ncbi:MAG: hypothetical protein ACK5QT_09325 [Oligoflexia bacterium]|jgi:hypothetical protein
MMGEWLSLMEYATRNGVSLSTLRRQIKGGKIDSRMEAGRYLVWDSRDPSASPNKIHPEPQSSREAELESMLKKAREEIAELKTLLAFYEEQPPTSPFSI